MADATPAPVAGEPGIDVTTVDGAAAAINKLGIFAPKAEEPKPERPRDDAGRFVRQEKVEAPPQPEAAPPDVPAEPEPDAEEPPALPRFTVKVDGVEMEVDEGELKAGYSRTQDYTRKTQALARDRQKFEQEELAAVRQERQALREKLDALESVLPSVGREPDWADLRNRLTPEQFADQFTQYQEARQRMAVIAEQKQALHQRMLADEQRALEAQLVKANERLGELIPEWKDPEKGPTLREDLVSYAKSEAYGYTDNDLAMITDPRLLVILNKARLYDQSQQRRTTLAERVDRAITAKPSAPAPKPKGKEVEAGMARFRETRSTEDAGALINKLGLVKPLRG